MEQHTVRGLRRTEIVAVLLMAIIALGAASAQARKKAKPHPATGLPDHVSRLASRLLGQDLEDSQSLTQQIQKLVVAHLEHWVANRSPNDVQVRREIERVFSKLRYPATAQAAVFEAQWKGENLIAAGYSLGWSNIWRRNVVVLFATRNGHTQKVALTTFVPRTDLHYVLLPPSAAGDFRFIIYGSRLGMSQPRLTAALYSFDGKTLRSSWEIKDLYDGQLSVQGKTLFVRYLDRSEYIRQTAEGHYPPRHVRTYTITPQGLMLAGEHEVAY